ncbi:asparagine synthase-related protein [Sphingomonas sp. LB-2]|uniref:asparagine synthetase B family protein n=1 Tax=Sphingomonas caeni TaxID=2984949 RepID=UPI0022303FB9|nr:asparagine synthase-related protein [Sphingomonas caeni]MCW3847394.1 asparagine synthase-related protein [Sphingomonas caeni]
MRAEGAWAFAYYPPRYLATEPGAPQPFDLASGAKLFVEARLDDRDALLRELGPGAGAKDDPALIAAAYDRWGLSAPERLYGEFALVHWDEAARRVTLARDALGTRALFYHFDGQALRFATAIHHLLAMAGVPRDLDDLGVTDFLVGATDMPERTLYRDIRRVPAGGTATFDQTGCRTARYWTLDAIAPVRLARDEDYVEAARDLLDKAVASRLPAGGTVATMLSGGFDSAAVTATAARLLGGQGLTAFTRVAGAHNPYTRFDEKAFAGLVAARYPNIDWVVVDDLHQAERDVHPEWESATMGLPVTPFPRTWFEPIHQRAAAIGVRTLLTGGMGNATLSWSGNALCFEQVRGGRMISAVRGVIQRTRREGGSVARALRSEIGAAIQPRALRRWQVGRRTDERARWQMSAALSPDFLQSLDYESHTESAAHDILRRVPLSGRARRWSMLQREDMADRAAYLRGHLPHEMLDPFSDRRIAEFTLGVPERQYQRDGVRRHLARRAFADRLPEALLAQTRRGRQIGEWYHLANLRREQTAEAVERLSRSPLASRILDVKHLKTLVDTWPGNAEEAQRSERQHRYVLHFSVAMGAFLRWHEGSNG